MHVEALVAEGSIERLDERIVSWFAGTREIDLCTVLVGPQIHSLTDEFAPIVTEQQLRHSAFVFQLIQGSHYILSPEALAGFNGHTLPGKHIDDR